jgi:TolB-like protein/DNA-binding winged helix-turn-helix (wHTH) protein
LDKRKMRDVPGPGDLNLSRGASSLVRFAGLAFDLDACTLVRESGEAIALTRGEFVLLRLFVTRPGRVINRESLLEALANRRFEPFDRSVDVFIGKLRRKIEPNPKEPRLIVTVPGQGYRFDGLAKAPLFDPKTSVAILHSQDDEQQQGENTRNGGLSDQHIEPELTQSAPNSAPPATTADPTKLPASKPSLGYAPLAAGMVLLFLAVAAAWFLTPDRGVKLAQAGHLSVVALPFANLSGDPSQDYLADGITDNLTTELSRIRDSFVIARNTAFTYKGKNVDAKQLGKELGVRYVLEGSVQRDGNRVRVNAQLVDAETGAHLWADRFEEDVADLFKLQDEVVARLARSLGLALTRAEAEKARSKNPDAVDLTMRAFEVIIRGIDSKSKNLEARALFERALQIDPDDAEALAGTAETYFYDWFYGWRDPAIDYDAKVLGLTNRAIGLAPDDPYVYYPKALYLAVSGRPADALGAANAGLDVNPNDVLLYQPRGVAENSLGQYGQAKADMERAIRLSPHDILMGIFRVILGDAEINLGHFDAAIDAYRKALDSGFRQFFVYSNLAAAYAHVGKIDQAKAALTEARRLNPKITLKWMKENSPNLPAVYDGLRKAGLPEE